MNSERVGYAIGAIIGYLWVYKLYVFIFIGFYIILNKLDTWFHFDPFQSFFFLILFACWLVMEIRVRKYMDRGLFSTIIRYVKWYIKNIRLFLEGD